MADRTNRGQPATVGTLLLILVISVTVAIGGGFVLTNMYQQAPDDEPLMTCSITYADSNVTISHEGGEAIDRARLDVMYRNTSGESQLDFDRNGGSTFAPGETVLLGSLSEETEVLLVSDTAVLCEKTLQPAVEDTTTVEDGTTTSTSEDDEEEEEEEGNDTEDEEDDEGEGDEENEEEWDDEDDGEEHDAEEDEAVENNGGGNGQGTGENGHPWG